MERRSSRREFLKKGIRAGGALAAPALVARWGYGREGGAPPTDRIRVAHLGVGGRGLSLLSQSLSASEVEVAAVCDVDSVHLGRRGRRPGGR